MKKNFLLIILLVFMMIGCVSEGLRQTYGDEWMEANSDWRAEKKTIDNSSSEVRYCEQPVLVDNISYDWQGGPSNPVFAVYLFSREAAEVVKSETVSNPKEMPVGAPCFRLNISGNLTFSTESSYSARTIGVYDNLAMQYINGLAAKFDGTGYVTLYLDKGLLNLDQITVLGKDVPNGEARFKETSFYQTMTDQDFINMVACTVALVPSNPMYKTIGTFSDWLAKLVIMNEAESFPTNVLTPNLPKAHTPADINYVIGTVSSESTADATSDNLVNGEYVFTASKTDEHWFKFIIAGNGYDYQIGAVNNIVQSLNADIPLKNGTYTNNVKFNAEAGSTYQITYNPNVPSCKINKITE